jgi:hypothetical protein
MSRKREIAKFACGAQTFHALTHAMFWAMGKPVTIAGIRMTPEANGLAAIVNAATAIGLGLYAWPRAVPMLQAPGPVPVSDEELEPVHAGAA